ncbi:hypothetical protein FQR65_LT16769 [Abscondita terminalis]|nr:hypothetical protein FQR65_LT16769 [Abscondita terminalis]
MEMGEGDEVKQKQGAKVEEEVGAQEEEEEKTKNVGVIKEEDQAGTNVVEIEPEQTTLTDEILPKQSQKRKPKRKRSPSLLPTRRSKILESVDSSVDVLQTEEPSNATIVDSAETHQEPMEVQVKTCRERDLRNSALDKLLSKYKEIDAKATRDAVLKKINSLRTAYQKERKKVEESTRSGAGADAVYVPKLWYYQELSFINDQNVARTSVSNMDENEGSADEEQQIEQHHMDIDNNWQPNEILTQANEESDHDGSEAVNSARRPKPKRKNEDNLVNKVLQSVNDHFKRPRDEVRKEDRHDIYCKSIASKLRELPRQQRMLAEKLMNDVIFEAEWGNLTLDYKVLNTGPRHRRYATSDSSHSASPSPNMQHHQQTVSPSYPITSHSHSCSQNVQDGLHFSQRHEAPGPEDLLSTTSTDSAASFLVNFMSE